MDRSYLLTTSFPTSISKPPRPTKILISIRPDGDIIEHFTNLVHQSGGGNYQGLINDALRERIWALDHSMEKGYA